MYTMYAKGQVRTQAIGMVLLQTNSVVEEAV